MTTISVELVGPFYVGDVMATAFMIDGKHYSLPRNIANQIWDSMINIPRGVIQFRYIFDHDRNLITVERLGWSTEIFWSVDESN